MAGFRVPPRQKQAQNTISLRLAQDSADGSILETSLARSEQIILQHRHPIGMRRSLSGPLRGVHTCAHTLVLMHMRYPWQRLANYGDARLAIGFSPPPTAAISVCLSPDDS